jgi:hypothetical protein
MRVHLVQFVASAIRAVPVIALFACGSGNPTIGQTGVGDKDREGGAPFDGAADSPPDMQADAPLAMVDAGDEPAGSMLCQLPPERPDAGPCPSLPFNAAAQSYVLWVQDPSADSGGVRVTFPAVASPAVTVANHTYRSNGDGLVGGGQFGLYGDAIFEVDGQRTGLTFHFEGCVAPIGEETWEATTAMTRQSILCPDCAPASIARHYTITRTSTGARSTYRFTADEPPRECGFGADLLELDLPE